MSGWIKFDKDMANDPRLVEAATKLLDRYIVANRTPGGGSDLSLGDASRFVTVTLRGALVTLWCHADEHIRDDDSLPCSSRAVDAIVGIDGFCDLMPDEWLTVGEDGLVILPGYCAKNALIAKKKSAIAGAERTKRWREKRAQMRNASRDASPKASQRGLRDVTVTADQDQDQDKKKKPPKPPGIVPDGLDTTAWNQFTKYRKDIGKPIKPASVAEAQRRLAAHGAHQAEVVKQTIANGWQGIFDLKGNTNGRSNGSRRLNAAEQAFADYKTRYIDEPQGGGVGPAGHQADLANGTDRLI